MSIWAKLHRVSTAYQGAQGTARQAKCVRSGKSLPDACSTISHLKTSHADPDSWGTLTAYQDCLICQQKLLLAPGMDKAP